MPRFVYRNGQVVDAETAGPKHISSKAPNVIGDVMPETRHMADGHYYSSKSQFRAATKAAGCREVGNEVATLLKPRAPTVFKREYRRQEIRQAIRRQLRGEHA